MVDAAVQCHRDRGQLLDLILRGDGNVAYTNMPYVLDAGGSCGANSVRSALDGDCSGNWNQKRSLTNGTLLNPQSGKCLDVAGGGTANGGPVEIWDCGASQSNQTWHFS